MAIIFIPSYTVERHKLISHVCLSSDLLTEKLRSNPVRSSRLVCLYATLSRNDAFVHIVHLYLHHWRPLPSLRNKVAHRLTRRDNLIGMDKYFLQDLDEGYYAFRSKHKKNRNQPPIKPSIHSYGAVIIVH